MGHSEEQKSQRSRNWRGAQRTLGVEFWSNECSGAAQTERELDMRRVPDRRRVGSGWRRMWVVLPGG